jgi:hypothetical protein
MIKPKAVKVYLWGERMKDIYPHATKWQVFKYKTAIFLRKLTLALLVALAIALTAINTFPKHQIVDKVIEVDNLDTKIVELKGEVLDTLRSCESRGGKESDGLITFDSNKQASIGTYQFQKDTVIRYYKALYGKDITGKEAVMIALDDSQSRQLANDIIFSNDAKGIGNWYNCENKNNLSDNIKWINKISK